MLLLRGTVYRYDADHDGVLSVMEFLKICKDENMNLSEDQIILSGYKLDKSKNGTVDFLEFELFWNAPDHAAFLAMTPDDVRIIKVAPLTYPPVLDIYSP